MRELEQDWTHADGVDAHRMLDALDAAEASAKARARREREQRRMERGMSHGR